MRALTKSSRTAFSIIISAAAISLSAYSSFAGAEDVQVNLSGDQEVPPVHTAAGGRGTISVAEDKTVKGSVTTSGVAGTMAHIHEGAPGHNGGVAIPLEKSGDNGWSVPAGAKLTDAQYKAFKAGNLYVNVHSAQHKGGEIRGQLKP